MVQPAELVCDPAAATELLLDPFDETLQGRSVHLGERWVRLLQQGQESFSTAAAELLDEGVRDDHVSIKHAVMMHG